MPKSKSKRRRPQPPPKPKPKKSPPWVGALFFVLLGLGVAVIILNYLSLVPGGTRPVNLFIGLGLMAAAFVVATRWH
ncbi:MAG: cell division protein CrgA [Actinobacteria bacterium]|jgi:hypothetical protein|nr:cell division protein CrgA [Actinomycetota bacterium]